VLLLPFGPLTRWQRDDLSTPLRLLRPWAVLAVLAGAAAWFALPGGGWKVAAAFAAGAWVLLGTARFVHRRWTTSGGRLTAEMVGMSLAHAGVALFFFGVLMTEGLSIEKDVAVRPGERVALRGYDFEFAGVERIAGPNYLADRGTVRVHRGGAAIAVLQPEKRAYASGGAIMTEAAIDPGPHRDLYVALGEPLDERGTWALRLYVKPFIRFIWLGALLMAAGAFTVLFDKRFRPARYKAAA
jgi:cytochrome c-type biogenesis protein CcmF